MAEIRQIFECTTSSTVGGGEEYVNLWVGKFQRGGASRAAVRHHLRKMSSVRLELGSRGSNIKLAVSGHHGECVMLRLGTQTL